MEDGGGGGRPERWRVTIWFHWVDGVGLVFPLGGSEFLKFLGGKQEKKNEGVLV